MDTKNVYKQGLYLEYFTVSYNFIEAGVAIFLGTIASSIALIADAKETMACALLSLALLIGLGLHYLFGFWQADPFVALIIVIFLFREGWESWEEAGNANV